MRLFDLHCDTIEELKKRGEDYLNCTTQFSLRDREKFQKAVQVMAVLCLMISAGRRQCSSYWITTSTWTTR